jgi:hypothetical protein
MCLPISVLTQGRISGCHGVCNLWPYISAIVVLCAGLVWNFVRGGFRRKENAAAN